MGHTSPRMSQLSCQLTAFSRQFLGETAKRPSICDTGSFRLPGRFALSRHSGEGWNPLRPATSQRIRSWRVLRTTLRTQTVLTRAVLRLAQDERIGARWSPLTKADSYQLLRHWPEFRRVHQVGVLGYQQAPDSGDVGSGPLRVGVHGVFAFFQVLEVVVSPDVGHLV